MFTRYTFVALIVSVILFASCSEKENTEVEQYDRFSSYLKSTYENSEYYYDSIDRKMFRLFVYSNETDGSLQTIEQGDSVYVDYTLSAFSSSSGAGTVYFTSIPGEIAEDTGLNPEYWPMNELGFSLGKTPMVKGLEMGFPGCKETDTVMFFLPSTLNFGGKQVGVVPAETPVVWTFIINKVVK